MPLETLLTSEAGRLGWPVVFRGDVDLDLIQIRLEPSRFASGFGWLIHETGTFVIPPEPGAAPVIDTLATAYPDGRWYFATAESLEEMAADALASRLDAIRLSAAA